MKILVCGGRYFGWAGAEVNFIISHLHSNLNFSNRITVVAGEADGADLIGKYCAKVIFECDYKGYPADWNKYGRAAGPIRNAEMLECNPDIDLVVAFPGGRGTSDMITKAKNENIKVIEPIFYVPYEDLEAERKGKDFPWPDLRNL